MLETVDLTRRLKKSRYKELIPDLELKLGDLQRNARKWKIPIVIVFEGLEASGKGTHTNKLLLALDPRGFSVYPTHPANEEERRKPFLWRFWTKIPEGGRIAIFDRSWYGRFMVERMDKTITEQDWMRAYGEIRSFEKQLVDAGAVIVKIFLHISQAEQRKRFMKLQSSPSTAWRITDYDWQKHENYPECLSVASEMLRKTHSEFAPWTAVAAEEWRSANIKIFKTVIHAVDGRVRQLENGDPATRPKPQKLEKTPSGLLDGVDLSKSMKKSDYRKALKKYQVRIKNLEHEVHRRRIPVVLVYEGWDAAGKGGNIKRLVQNMDPRGYEVIPVSAPNDTEMEHHYLWRFWNRMPKTGHITIFDRSWYGRVLVERIEGFCSESEWKRAYREINEMEEHLTNFGAVILKFWMHVDKDEQLNRFTDRKKLPHKRWKLGDEDWRNREKWDEYEEAVEEMIHRTSTPNAPWVIVESNSKYYARIKVLKTVTRKLESRLGIRH